MAPIKFDNHIREQLQEREIQPSKDAWKKLQTQLSQAPKKKNNTKWYAIAASVVGFIIITSMLFNKTLRTPIRPEIVEANSSQKQIIPIKIDQLTKNKAFKTKEEFLKQETELVQEDTSDKIKNSSKVVSLEKPKKINKKETEIAFQSKDFSTEKEKIDTNKKEILITSETEITSTKVNTEEDFENAKVVEVVAQVTQLQSANNTVSADEIEALLAKAQQEIAAQKLLSNNNKKVDAMALLNLVEEELETSFRDKVFEKLGDSFQKVRTAVVNRDN